MIGCRGDAQELARLQVDPDLDGEAGVAVKRSSGVTAAQPTTAADRVRSPTPRPSAVVASMPCCLTITTTGKVTLLIVAGLFIAWALITAIWIPEAEPRLPRHADRVPARLGAVPRRPARHRVLGHLDAGGRDRGGGTARREHDAGRDRHRRDDRPGDHTSQAPTPTSRRGQGGLRVRRLRRVPHARRCRRDRDRRPEPRRGEAAGRLVVTRVTNGMGAMPPFKGQLSDKQIQDVAAYVSSVAGKS